MLQFLTSLYSYRGLGLLFNALALPSKFLPSVFFSDSNRAVESIPFDGQHLNANASNNATDYWWGMAIGEPEGDNPPPSFQLVFYQGYPFQFGPRDPNLPEYYIVINGFFPNGTNFALTIPATSGVVTADGEKITGVWGDIASFEGSHDFSTWTARFTAPAYGLVGIFELTSNADHHYACNTTAGPYFSDLVAEKSLSLAEDTLYNKLGWAIATPGASSKVDMNINGAPLKFTGQGYHDSNWSPVPLNTAVSTWYFGSAQVGPYILSYTSATPLNSTLTLNTGYLARKTENAEKAVVIQNQCSIVGTKTTDISISTPFGLQNDTVSGGVKVPTGYIVEYILENGEHFTFNLTSPQGWQNPDTIVYHRWVGTASGGADGENYDGLTVFEWLNPGLTEYTPSQETY